jgi:hypothetical protein
MEGRFVSHPEHRQKPEWQPPGMKVAELRNASLQASERRLAEKRERRHRERAVAEWLRSLK